MKKIIKFVLLIIWLSVIYYFSNQPAVASLNESNSLLLAIAYVLRINDVDNFVSNYGPFIRELAHFTEFFILGFFVYINVYEYTNRKTTLITIILCALYAVSDEIHQFFVEGRVCTLMDVVIDTSGSITASFLCHLIEKYAAKRKSNKLWDTKSN